MIVTKGLTRYYGSVGALVDVDLHVPAGSIFGFIGPNGAGKTTTMRILATLLSATRGQAFIDGKNVATAGRDVRRLVGYMPDFMGVYDDLKVVEYLDFFAAAFGIERRRRKAIVDGVLELTDLKGKMLTTVDSLSRGMQQRLGLARVLTHDPKVLILDEPASGLDPRARVEIRELLRELRDMGKTIMIASHILSELEEICDYVGIIEQGKLVFTGTLDDLHQKIGVGNSFRLRAIGDDQRIIDLLQALPTVREVTRQKDYFLVTFHQGKNAEGLIARTLVRADIDVLELTPEKLKLDEAFMQLTEGLVH